MIKDFKPESLQYSRKNYHIIPDFFHNGVIKYVQLQTRQAVKYLKGKTLQPKKEPRSLAEQPANFDLTMTHSKARNTGAYLQIPNLKQQTTKEYFRGFMDMMNLGKESS